MHKRLSQLVDADIQEGLAFRSLQLARYQRLLKAVWTQAVEGDATAFQQALQVLNKLDVLFGLAKLPEINVNIDNRSVNVVDSQLAADGTDYRKILMDRIQAIADRRETLSNDQLADIVDVEDNGPRPLFRVIYEDDSPRENGASPPALPEPEGQQLEAPPVESIEEPEDRACRRRQAGNHRRDAGVDDADGEAPERPVTVAEQQHRNMAGWLATD